MQPDDAARRAAHDPHALPASADAGDRWQGPGFAASWISPPRPQRYAEDPTAPFRSDDHA